METTSSVNELKYNKHRNRQNNEVVAAMYAMYQSGEDGKPKSLAEIAKVYRKTRQAVYDMFRSRGYPLRSKKLKGLQVVDGIIFTLDVRGYLRGTYHRRRMFLHTYLWEKHHGPIAKGYGVRHKDRNKSNNDINNLEIYSIFKNEKRQRGGGDNGGDIVENRTPGIPDHGAPNTKANPAYH